MNYDLIIRQSYHGNGGKEGYKFKLYDIKGKKLGELKNVCVNCNVGNTISINNVFYIISKIYSSPKPREERSEVIYYELNKYVFKVDFNLGEIIK
jgi:sporulation protein YlmC with PRC-barrel domain